MNSVETDELLYDGGSRGATQDEIDMERADRRRESRERVETLVKQRDGHTLMTIHDTFCNVCDEAYRLHVLGYREKAWAMFSSAVDDAVEVMVERGAA